MKLSKVCLGAIAIAGLVLVACNKEEVETVYAPTLAVSASAIAAAQSGGSYSFTYTVTNSAEDGVLSVETSANWISDISDSGSTISFNVSENDSDASRTGRITLSYKSSYGTLSATVTVAQNAGTAPTLSVQPIAVTADTEGGNYSFSYTVTSPAADGELSCSTTADWITDFDCNTSGKVSFTVSANGTGVIRSADISVFYDSSYGTLEKTVAVIQDHEGGYGGSDFDGTLSSLYGTYEASGYAIDYYTDAATYQTWTMTVYPDYYEGELYDDVIIDGLTPYYAGMYSVYGYEDALGFGYLDDDGSFIIPSFQSYGYIDTDDDGETYYAYGYVSCAGVENGTWYYSQNDCAFTYSSSDGSWTAGDYGSMFAALGVELDWDEMTMQLTGDLEGFFDATCPGVTIKKLSDDYGTIPTSVSQASASKADKFKVAPYAKNGKSGSAVMHPIGEGLRLHADFICK